MPRLITTLGLAAAFWTAGQAPARADEALDKELATMARQVSDFLERIGQKQLAIGQFTCPPQLNSSAGPSIAKGLADELGGCGIELKRVAALGLKGEYHLSVTGGPDGPEARIKGQIDDIHGKQVFSFTRNVTGTAALASLFGLTCDLPPSASEKERSRRVVESLQQPRVEVETTRVSASKASPYGIEVLVKSGDTYVPRTPTDGEELAFVGIARDETYAVRLINDSDQDAAVTLTIDGLNMFAFSENKDYRHVIVPKHQSGPIKGWHITNETSDSFVVTAYARSAAAGVNPANSEIGTITATFAAAWPEGARPADEPPPTRGADATGRGPRVDAKFTVVERHTGVIRSSVSVRYTRKK